MYIGLNKDRTETIGIGKTCLISKRHAESLDKAIDIITKSGAPVEKIVLYGSCARGKAKYDSDVDIAVILNDKATDACRNKLTELKSVTCGITDPDIDMHYISASKYNKANDAYIQSVKRDEVTVWKM